VPAARNTGAADREEEGCRPPGRRRGATDREEKGHRWEEDVLPTAREKGVVAGKKKKKRRRP
jgi:hypothetical protein